MNLDEIIQSTLYLEFINSLDNLAFELLYSKEGYINLSPKEAIEEFEPTILKFKNKAQELAQNTSFREKENILEQKFNEFIEQIKKYYQKQVYKRAHKAYSERIDNCLLKASINKNNLNKKNEIFSKGISCINWIVEVEKGNNQKRQSLIENFKEDFTTAINSKDEDFLAKSSPEKSNIKRFLALYELISKDCERFMTYNLDFEINYLNSKDLNLLKQKQKELQSYKKTSVTDEVNFMESALNLLNLKKDDEKYSFIRQVQDDFELFVSNNKKIEDTDKINIVKKRINLFNEKDRINYYKKVLA